MKKRIFPIVSLVGILLLGLLLFHPTVQSAINLATGESVSDNQTIRILAEKLEGASQEEIDAYFGPFGDDKKIIADPSGGFLTSIDDRYTVSKRQDWTGRTIVQSFDDPKVAATIGEVKEYLRNH